ncbi:MAG TPA: hypothetical protein VG826_01410 [Pirellulales bacterium]|nr:hypothetical protein [Pirellulales bacterium]
MFHARFSSASISLLASLFAMASVFAHAGGITKASADDQANSQPDRAALFKQLDADGDGHIGQDDVSDDQRRLFGRLLRRGDANADGKLSLEEFSGALADDPPDARPRAAQQAGQRGTDGDRFRQFLEADPQELFKQLDTNGDGQIEPDEVPQQARGRLEQLMLDYDANRDKALSLAEFRRGHEMLRTQAGISQPAPPQPRGLLGVLDTDGDGKLSKKEIASADESLRKLDRDNDGELSPGELAAVLPPQPGQAPAPTAKSPEGDGRPGPARLLERLRSLDADGDGKWSESELPPFLRQQFAKIDANKDGSVDADELRQAVPLLRRPQQ